MVEQPQESEKQDENTEPHVVNLSMSARAERPTASFTLEVIPADDIQVEDSESLRYLRLRNGDYQCYKRVFLIVGGEKMEITVDSLPDAPSV